MPAPAARRFLLLLFRVHRRVRAFLRRLPGRGWPDAGRNRRGDGAAPVHAHRRAAPVGLACRSPAAGTCAWCASPRWRRALCWLGMFASTSFLWICAVILAMGFFLSSALPLVEATTLTHLGEHTGALRRDPAVGIDRLHRRGGRRRLCARFFRGGRAAVDRARVAARHARVLPGGCRKPSRRAMHPTGSRSPAS